MLVYKTIENDETKFYGVTNNDFFADNLINDYDNAENAGMIDYEYPTSNRTNKLIGLAVENITTMRQAFEVYSIINNQSLKDTRKDFRFEMEVYSDDKPETFYRVATLDDFKDVMFENTSLEYWGINSLLDWLKNNVNDFDYTCVNGYGQGEACAFYKFNSSKDDGYLYLPLDEETLMSIYGGVIDIEELEKDKQGHALLNDNGNVIDSVCGLYADDYTNNNDINDYMRVYYNAVLADKKVFYC